MIAFDVFVNGKKLHRAGVGADGVLNTIVTWVKLKGEAAVHARRHRQPGQEAIVQTGGLSRDTHWRWPQRMLKIGDRVTVAIAEARTVDRPTGQTRDDPRRRQQQERRYYLRLKDKYESAAENGQTTFLNVDLDLQSSSSLQALVEGFGRRAFLLHAGREGRRYGAHFELATQPRDPDRVIRDFVKLVRGLPRASRSVWDDALRREFNVGVQAGTRPYDYQFRLRPETLADVARLKAHVTVTVYAAAATNDRA
jgi:hypothetical protein